MSWAQAAVGPLRGATCLWQDLHGLHVERAPEIAPPTSVLWGWLEGVRLVRVRLDDQTAFVAVLTGADIHGTRALPWSPSDGRVASAQGRGPDARDGGVGAAYEQVIVDGIDDRTGPVTFIRPVPSAGHD
jgi:hypothetical protein